jgi:hypothetical protein
MFLHILLLGLTISLANGTKNLKKPPSVDLIDLFEEWKLWDQCDLYPPEKYTKFYKNTLSSVMAEVGKETALNQKLHDLIFPFSPFEEREFFRAFVNFVSDYLRDCSDLSCKIRRRIKSAALLSPLLANSTEKFLSELANYFKATGLLQSEGDRNDFVKALRYFKHKYFCDLGSTKERHMFFKRKEINYKDISYFYRKYTKIKGRKFSQQEQTSIEKFINELMNIHSFH